MDVSLRKANSFVFHKIPCMYYPVKIPWLVEKVMYPKYTWSMPRTENSIYLSFDDGPHPEATAFVLEELRKFRAEASFFCIGKNVVSQPHMYKRIVDEGHSVGNHSYHHVNGWKVKDDLYVNDVALATECISSDLYRPPYGKITGRQARQIKEKLRLNIVMWSVLSGDFDRALSPEACLRNVLGAVRPGSIIVFHDSEKAFSKMSYVLPRVLDYCTGKGYSCRKIVL